MDNKELEFIAKNFLENKTLQYSKMLQGGIINQTYLVALRNTNTSKYILQKINTNVLRNPQIVMSNSSRISEHIEKKINSNKKLFYKNFKIYPCEKGDFYYIYSDNSYWRLIDYIDAKTVDSKNINTRIVREAGIILGRFHTLLSDISISKIQESIPNFHDTDLYYDRLLICAKKKPERLHKTIELFNKIKEYRYLIDVFLNLKEKKLLPIRIVHNDPKLDNILFDSEGKACTIIDLDTCMPGYLTFDFGDAIRSITNTASENEKDLEKVHFDLERFKVFCKAYIHKVKSFIKPTERKYLAFFTLLVTYEQLIRFYKDYIQNDIYYKIDYPSHNLQRAKVQLKLLEEMLMGYEKMKLACKAFNTQ